MNCVGAIVSGQFDLCNLSLVVAHENGEHQAQANLEDKVVDDNFTTTHRLSLRIDSHNSTLSFTLDTLAQHQTLIGQLQDEVVFLRRQRKAMKARLDVKDTSPSSSIQSHNEEDDNRPGSNEDLPDLNVTLEPPPDEDSIKNEQ